MNTTQNVKQFKDHETAALASKPPADASNKDWDTVKALNQCLAHSLELSSRIKQAHWSAKGENFFLFSKMATDFTERLEKQADKLSARIVAIGGVPNWTAEKIVKTSTLPSYPSDLVKVEDHIEALRISFEQTARQLSTLLSKLAKSDDYVTANTVMTLTKIVDEQKAFIAAHSGLAWLEKPKKQYA